MRPICAMLLAVFGWVWAAGEVTAQDYPSRPITVVVPFPAGGPSDTLVRILGEQMRGRSASPSSSRMSPAPRAASRSAGWRARRPMATR